MGQVASVQLQVSRNNIETLCKKEGASFEQRCHPRRSLLNCVTASGPAWQSPPLLALRSSSRLVATASSPPSWQTGVFIFPKYSLSPDTVSRPRVKGQVRGLLFFIFLCEAGCGGFPSLAAVSGEPSGANQLQPLRCNLSSVQGVRGVDSARWPNSNPPGGVAQGGLLIPVISSEFGVDGGGVERKDGHGSGTSRSGRSNMLWEWMTFEARRCAAVPNHVLSHTPVCVKGRSCSNVRDTDKTDKNVRATRCSVFTSRRVHDTR